MKKRNLILILAIWMPIMLIVLMLFVSCQSGGGTVATSTSSPAETSGTTAAETAAPAVTATATETAAAPVEHKPITGKFKRKSNRDPFMPVVGLPQPSPLPGQMPTQGPTVIITQPGESPKPRPKTIPKPTIVDVPQEQVGVTIVGIVRVEGSYVAMLRSSGGRSYNVRVGQMVGEWRVHSITPSSVILTARGYRSILRMGGAGRTHTQPEGPTLPPGIAPPPAPK